MNNEYKKTLANRLYSQGWLDRESLDTLKLRLNRRLRKKEVEQGQELSKIREELAILELNLSKSQA